MNELYKTVKEKGDIRQSIEECRNIFNSVKKTNKLSGNLAEVGVFQGGSARVICEAKKVDKILYLFDTFEGFPWKKDIAMGDTFSHSIGDLKVDLVKVTNLLSGFANIIYCKGIFPDTAIGLKPEQFSFVHLDVDYYKATLEALKFFFPRLVNGGIMLVHDFNKRGFKGVNNALNEYFGEDFNKWVNPLPSTNQCIIEKMNKMPEWWTRAEQFQKNDKYELEFKKCFCEVASRPNINVFLDLGAFVGLYTEMFARIKRDKATIYAFEPDSRKFECLKQKINICREEYGSVIEVFDTAITNRCGNDTLYVSPTHKGFSGGLDRSFIERAHVPLEPITVEVRTLDYYFADKRVDLIKMDIEAEEVKALEGARSLLRKQSPMVFISAHKGLYEEVYSLMHELGYETSKYNPNFFEKNV